jgi:hypothetical protein
MVPFTYIKNTPDTEMAQIYPDPNNPAQLIVKFRHIKLFNVKDIPRVFGQVDFTYQNPTIINGEDFVNEFQITHWYLSLT